MKGLQIEDFDWERGTVWVQGKGSATGRAPPRQVPVPLRLMEAAKQLAGPRRRGKLVDMSVASVYWLVKRCARLAGFQDWQRVHPHRPRHAGGREFFKVAGENDKGLVQTRDYLGHRDIKTTMTYHGRSSVEDLAKVARKMTSA